ncbi:unnamed protein product [Rotaria sp. Silwood2]|nr:unnamed protein product [Rotaria sp. Silwood2]CAF4455209.1 unnamed protein product [Rotaria sp. Silwood2]
MYLQQQQRRQNNLPSSSYSIPNGIQLDRQYQYGYQQQPMVYQPYGVDMPLNWQFQNNWMGGAESWINGQQQMPLQAPPFYYPIDNGMLTTVVPSSNQVQYKDNSVMPSKRRGILKIRKEPTQRRLVHFMPESWQKKTKPDNRGKKPDQMNNKGQKQKTIKSPEKARLDTLRRTARRQRQRAALLEKSNELGCFNGNNRFSLLSEIDDDNDNGYTTDNSEADHQTEAMKNNKKIKQKNLSKKHKRQAKTTTEVQIIDEHVVKNNIKARGNNQRQINFSDSEREEENDNVKSPFLNKDKRKCKSYLQTFKILAYLKDRVNKDNKIKLDIKDVFNEVCEYAKNTIETYDSWVHNHYEAQVWQHIYDLGKEKDHWAKEIVNITHTREAKINVSICEKKLAQLTTTCFDANNIITRNMRELSSKTATVATQRVHNLILDYIKEATQGLAKMSINRIRRASIEKDEWDALKTFENVASEQQKMYAKTFCKSTLYNYHKKKKRFELVAAHISYDIIPKILPKYDFNLPVDENSLTSEQTQEYKKSIQNLSKDFRLKATELYLGIVKEEFEFQKERLQKLLHDFPQDRYEVPSTQIDDDDEEPLDNEVFTQKPLSQQQETINNQKGSELFKKYIEIAHKRAQLEIEREVHFLSERGVQETPVETQESKDLNPVMRMDFVLQA